MLVGLYRSNPDAFIGENMNRLKAGAVLQVPAGDSLGAVSQDEARQVIQAQSADFSAYRQRLAGAAPTLQQEGSERQAKGKVQAAVEDRKPAGTSTPDKLTLSKAASAAAESKASKETEKKDAAARLAELTRNVEEFEEALQRDQAGSAGTGRRARAGGACRGATAGADTSPRASRRSSPTPPRRSCCRHPGPRPRRPAPRPRRRPSPQRRNARNPACWTSSWTARCCWPWPPCWRPAW